MKIEQVRKSKIGVLCGGMSTEREISIKSGNAVLKALKQMKFNACKILVDKDIASKIKKAKIKIAFPVLHGVFGEDGTIQGLLEMMGLPYTGCGIFASAASIDKNISKRLLKIQTIATPPWFTLKQFQKIPKIKKYPVVIKPVIGGSTIGISIAKNYKQFLQGIKLAFKYDKQIIVEDFIKGTEITVAVLAGQVLPIVEIVAKSGFYDFKAKYQKGGSTHIIPARISAKAYKVAQDYALKVFNGFNCKAICRVDMMVDDKDKVWVLENNTLPGMTQTSLLPDAAKFAGISFNDIVLKILESL
jgi:D-alanine-D-alanine ligase